MLWRRQVKKFFYSHARLFRSMDVIVCMHVIRPIWHTHQSEDKKQAWLELNMYFDKLMCMVTNTLGYQHRHYESICCWSRCTQDNDAHVIRRVWQRSHISVPEYNGGKSSLSIECHHWAHRHHHEWPSLASVHHHWRSWGYRRFFLPTTVQVLVIVGMTCSSLFCLTWVHV